jgi:hypothetical protein
MDNNPIYLIDPQGLGTDTEPTKHKVEKGDTYSSIAKKYNVAVDDLRKWNGYADTKVPVGVELIVSDPTVAENQNKYAAYEAKYTKLHSSGTILALAVGLGAFSNRLAGHAIDPSMSEDQKENYFNTSADKTIAILMMEFATGTGYGHHEFFDHNPITASIAASIQTKLFIQWFKEEWIKGNIKEGESRYQRISTNPDKEKTVDVSTWDAHTKNSIAGFFTQGMEFTGIVKNGTLYIRATDRYSIASGLTRNDNDNLSRVPGFQCPMGSTSFGFNFSIKFP